MDFHLVFTHHQVIRENIMGRFEPQLLVESPGGYLVSHREFGADRLEHGHFVCVFGFPLYQFFYQYDLSEVVMRVFDGAAKIPEPGPVFFFQEGLRQSIVIEDFHEGSPVIGGAKQTINQLLPVGIGFDGRMTKTVFVARIQRPAFKYPDLGIKIVADMVYQGDDGIEAVYLSGCHPMVYVREGQLQIHPCPVFTEKAFPGLPGDFAADGSFCCHG
jgi:hypothetical protein